jgi:hypothetical protein
MFIYWNKKLMKWLWQYKAWKLRLSSHLSARKGHLIQRKSTSLKFQSLTTCSSKSRITQNNLKSSIYTCGLFRKDRLLLEVSELKRVVVRYKIHYLQFLTRVRKRALLLSMQWLRSNDTRNWSNCLQKFILNETRFLCAINLELI